MDIRNNCKKLWNYINDAFEPEEIIAGFENAIEGFEYDPETINDEMIDSLNDEQVKTLFFDIGYMAVNELFGGDFGTWYDVLESLDLDEEAMSFLDFQRR